MQHQCYQLAGVLTPQEWRRFLAFARNNGGDYSPDLVRVVEAVADEHPAFLLTDEALWKQALPHKPYDNARLRILRSYLKELLEQFLIRLELDTDEVGERLLLSKALLRRGNLHRAQLELNTIRRALPRPSMRLETSEHWLRLEELSLDLAVKQMRVGPDYPWDSILQLVSNIPKLKRLQLLVGQVGTKGFFASRNEQMDRHIEEALASVDEATFAQEPLIRLLHLLLLLRLGHTGPESGDTVLELMGGQGVQMDREERVNVYLFLINHFFEQQRQRVAGSLELVHRAFVEMHSHDLIFGYGASTEVVIRNAIQVGIRLGEMEWVRRFLEVVHHRLPAADRERIFHYGSAQLAFGEGRFSDAKRHLARFETTTSAERLYHDNLLMRICYETNDRDGLDAISAALLRHLYRKEQIAESTKKGAINLGKAVLALFDLRWSAHSKADLEAVTASIGKLQPISHLDWIQAKLLELGATGHGTVG